MQVPPDEDEAKYIITDCLFANLKQLELARSLLCLVGGCIAGIVNATNVRGLLIFVSIYITIVLGLSAKMGFDLKNYANSTFLGFMMNDLSKHALSFVLFWTLTYALVYIY